MATSKFREPVCTLVMPAPAGTIWVGESRKRQRSTNSLHHWGTDQGSVRHLRRQSGVPGAARRVALSHVEDGPRSFAVNCKKAPVTLSLSRHIARNPSQRD